jgi:hypothetical protein
MDNGVISAFLNRAAPTLGAVGAAYWMQKRRDNIGLVVLAAAGGYLVADIAKDFVLRALEPPAILPTTPAVLPAAKSSAPVLEPSVPAPLAPGTTEVQDKIGNVIAIQRRADMSGGMRP